jgi:hypothetical protein
VSTELTTFARLAVLQLATAVAIVASIDAGAARSQNAPPRRPAPTLVAPATRVKPPDPDGFLQRWLLLEPIRVTGPLTDGAVQTLVRTKGFVPPFTAVPRDGETLTLGDTELTWRAVDSIAYNVNLFHFAYALNKPTSNALFWVVAVVNAPRELPGVRLAIGSNAASVWWVDGQQVIGIYNDRQTVIDDGVSRRLTLKKGPNVIRGAIVNAGGATDFCARFLDGEDRPIKGLTVSLADR